MKPNEIKIESWSKILHLHTEDADCVTDYGNVAPDEIIVAPDGTQYRVKVTLERINEDRIILQVAGDDKDQAYYVPRDTLLDFYRGVKNGTNEEKADLWALLREPHVEETVGVEDADYWVDPCSVKESVLEWEME